MSVWYCIPSARPIEEARKSLNKWRARGYKAALWRDKEEPGAEDLCDFLMTGIGSYPGYALATNAVISQVLQMDPSCNWVVCGGDDMEPDPNIAPEEIARQCSDRFAGSFGVMQPTGDRWGAEQGSAYADRVAGSPWIGRRFAETVNGGHGPFWHEYFHMGVDEELMAVAQRLGVFWQRQDLSHYHCHWGRENTERRNIPHFLQKANSPVEWEKYKRTFTQRKAAGFPGHLPVAS